MNDEGIRNKHFLRIEGVNFKAFLEDTLDLSIIRGGGLLLLKASEIAKEVISKYDPTVQEVNLGASVGIFSFEANGQTAEEIRAKVEERLAGDDQVKHATFVVDTEPAGGGFASTRSRLIAKNRWRQMQSLSVVYPGLQDGLRGGERVCEADHVRPAAVLIEHWDVEKKQARSEALSESAFVRHDYGRKQRTEFYRKEAGIETREFADDLNEIAGDANEYGAQPKSGSHSFGWKSFWRTVRAEMPKAGTTGRGVGPAARTPTRSLEAALQRN